MENELKETEINTTDTENEINDYEQTEPPRPEHKDTYIPPEEHDSYYSVNDPPEIQNSCLTVPPVKNESVSESTAVKLSVSPLILVILCLVSAIAGSFIFWGISKITDKKDSGYTGNGTSQITSSNKKDENSQGTNVSAGTKNEGNSDVTINVESVNSPATAVAQKVLPSIVGIQITVKKNSSWYGETTSIASEGSGVIFSEDGYIITNYHVISNAITSAGEVNGNAKVLVYLYTDSETAIEASIIGYETSADLAVIKIDRTGLEPIEIGDSDKISVGDIAIALGNPGGLEYLGSVSQGIISGLNRRIQTESSYENLTLIQTDAAINPGNSGGALVNVNGQLIGINSVKLAAVEYEGMGFSIPSNDVLAICTDIIRNGNRRMSYLGIELNSSYTAAYLERLGYPGGVLVDSVQSGSPAEAAGILPDDIIVKFNGVTVTTADELKSARMACQPGDKVKVYIYRLTTRSFGRWVGDYIELEVTMG